MTTLSQIDVSAPGKVILHGEHAVVYGKAAIAATINLRCWLKLEVTSDSTLSIDFPEVGVKKNFTTRSLQDHIPGFTSSCSVEDPLPASEGNLSKIKNFAGLNTDGIEASSLAVVAFLYIYSSIFKDKRELPSISVKIKSDLPVGAGLGSSAAYSVVTATALLQLAGHISCEKLDEKTRTWSKKDKEVMNKWAFIGEKVIHGTPSGIDNSVSIFGGALRLQKGKLDQIDKMPTLSVMLVNTKVARSTKALVGAVKEKYSIYEEIYKSIMDAVEAITTKAEETLTKIHSRQDEAHFNTLKDLIDLNHSMLNTVGVGHASLDQIVAVAKKNGLSAKLTGAGGGGCAYALIPPGTEESVLESTKKELENLGFHVWTKTNVGCDGVLMHL